MDEQRFDNLSRIIARSTSRRATVKGIAAAIGGGVFAGVFGVRAQRAGAQGTGQPGDSCDASDQCESGNCSGANGRSGVCYCVDPDRPWVGCSCEEGTEGPCGGGGVICCPSNNSPGGAGVCVPDSVGCNPTGCRAYPEDACDTSDDCCVGSCYDGTCACTPGLGWEGCSCDTGAQGECGGGSLLCCPTGSEPGGPGICTSSMTGCNPTGGCNADPGDECGGDDDCCTGTCMSGVCACEDPARPWIGCDCDTGTEAPCGGGTTLCCPTTSEPGGPGVCTSGMEGCQSVCTSDPGGECANDDDCCIGSCFSGICACTPGLGWEGCDCTVDGDDQCGAPTTLVCCQKSDAPTGDGVCTSGMTGCQVVCHADPGDECGSDADCCLGTCMSGICACNDPSRPIVGCPCEVGSDSACGGLADLCCNIGQEPGSSGSCISPMVGTCNPTGHCLADPGETCMVDSDCCEGKCSDDHVCYCADPAEPLRNCTCHTGTEDPCGGDSTLLCCDTDSTPGGDGICIPDRLGCESVGHCGVKGDSCLHDDDCCDKLACHDKKCGPKHHGSKPTPTPASTVTTLPSTGSGSDGGSDLGAWLGVAAAAGAAAIVAGRKLNQKPAEETDEA